MRRIPPVLFAIVVSAALAALLAIVSSVELLLGLCIGLLGTLLGVVYELYGRLERRIEAEDHLGSLLAAVDHAPWLLKELRDIASTAMNVLTEDRNQALFDDLVRAKVAQTKAYMQDLKRGHIRLPVDADITPMSNQIDLVRRTVMATTIPEVDTEWWLSVEGRDYLERNRRAIERRRRVRVERIVLWRESDLTARLAQVVREQQQAGVRLLFAKRSDVADERLRTNMAIYDETNYNDVVFNSDSKGIYAEYHLDPDDAKQAVARFKKLRGYATEEVPAELTEWLADPSPETPETPEGLISTEDDPDESSPAREA